MSKFKSICFFLFAVMLFYACNRKVNNENGCGKEISTDSLEIAVLNQTLSFAGYNILYNNYKVKFPKKFQRKLFEQEFENIDKKIVIDRLIQEGIDTSKINIGAITFLVFPDSLSQFEDSKPRKLDLTKINHPKETILITRNDDMLKNGIQPTLINISRVKFTSNMTKAEYIFEIVKGPLDGAGYRIKCEFKNGAWIIVEKEMNWIS